MAFSLRGRGILLRQLEQWGAPLTAALLPAYLVRFTIVGIPTSLLEVTVVGIFLLWLVEGRDELSRAIYIPRKLLLPLIIFFGAALVALFISPEPLRSLGVWKGWFVLPTIFFFLILITCHTVNDLWRVAVGLLIGGVAIAILVMGEGVGGLTTGDGRVNGPYESPNYIALYLVPIALMGLAAIAHWVAKTKENARTIKETRTVLFLFVFIEVLFVIALVLSHSLGGLVSLVVGTGVFAMLIIPRKRWQIFFSSVLVAGVLILVGGAPSRLIPWLTSETSTSLEARMQIWHTAVELGKSHPLLGLGLGVFQTPYATYLPSLYFPPLEWNVVHPHNLYLALWLEGGLLMLLAFLWMAFAAIRSLIVNLRAEDRFRREYRFLRAGLAAAIVAILIHGLIDTSYFKNDLAFLWWGIIGLAIASNYPFTEQKTPT
ncbi:MAG: O-antigen ligase family protein [Parcubacteria group bacterium]|nr:O-antigen ligase family protein [Parcubacteria group bacterium]